jgi:uncharacterized membrane protein
MFIHPRLKSLWDSLRTSYWFVPALMVIGAVVLDRAVLAVHDNAAATWLSWVEGLGAGEPENARALLTTVAGSMITVAGVTFSVVMVALSIASSQFGPRLLINFMRDRGNQVVLGTFVATFVYCILVLRRIGGGADGMPHLAVVVAVMLTLASLGVLIYFFHHVATSIQAGRIVAQAGDQLLREVDGEPGWRRSAHAPEVDVDDDERQLPEDFDERAASVEADAVGYVSDVDAESLLALAVEHDLVLVVQVAAGEFVSSETVVLRAASPERLDDAVAEELREAFLIARQRGTGRGLQLAVDRLVEIALRALSPGINDPFTALACIDRLAAGFVALAENGTPPRGRRDDDERLRLLLHQPSLAQLVDRAVAQIRTYGSDNPMVVERLLEALVLVTARSRNRRLRRSLAQQAERVMEAARRRQGDAADLSAAERHLETVRRWAD